VAEAKVAEATRLRAMKKDLLANLGVSRKSTPQRSIIQSFNAYADEETIDEPIDEDLEL